jgi:hypothetical protein
LKNLKLTLKYYENDRTARTVAQSSELSFHFEKIGFFYRKHS